MLALAVTLALVSLIGLGYTPPGAARNGVATAAAQPACPCSIFDPDSVPEVEAFDDPRAVELGVKIRAAVDGYVSAIRFYKGKGNTGRHVANLWTATGERLASVAFAEESDNGWQEVSLRRPVKLTAGATYVASYYAPAGHYALTRNYFAAGGDGDPAVLIALADGELGGNGVFKYGSSGFPDQSYQASNYWVDVVFHIGEPPASLDADGTVACPCSLFAAEATPEVADFDDPRPVEVGVKFRSSAEGYITGVRFYKGKGNTGRHVANLWTATGERLASAAFFEESAEGWQETLFAKPVKIAANTTYIASYHSSVGRYARTLGFFAALEDSDSVLHPLGDGVQGGNGVFKYGDSGFPTNTYQATNYWVDVVFHPMSADLAALTARATAVEEARSAALAALAAQEAAAAARAQSAPAAVAGGGPPAPFGYGAAFTTGAGCPPPPQPITTVESFAGGARVITTTTNYRGVEGLVQMSVVEEGQLQAVNLSVPSWLLAAYNGNTAALEYDIERGLLRDRTRCTG